METLYAYTNPDGSYTGGYSRYPVEGLDLVPVSSDDPEFAAAVEALQGTISA